MHCCKKKFNHNNRQPSSFTVSRRYGTENKAVIHSTHAFVLGLYVVDLLISVMPLFVLISVVGKMNL